ncbi:MAG: Protein containing DUF364 [uncultured bacterium]|uniref:Heavy-metal chelation domain-containing protein n=1 Tax=Candidatus Wallbacteria bacterium GWC2_49_35 TaxID=1817813 RepID=A0A1F7WVZ6_9BACT|nr:MAG: Protein containing DUF364 [uncultured bacterium]OGM06318.1 MAG: hypothetical protein A2008_10850 [Candidatus Wallbacteria bacterium GWC2_49_35]HBC73360.1 hypothetical protein [Candidatus Wallbacteria bacterium]
MNKGKENKTEISNIDFFLKELHDEAKARSAGAVVEKACVGVYMTCVENSLGKMGVSYTWRDENLVPHLCRGIKDAGNLRGKAMGEIIDLIDSPSSLERSLAMAGINSLLNADLSMQAQSGDMLLYLRDNFKGKKIAMVGHFPFADEMKKWAGEFHVIEKNPVGDDVLFEGAGKKYLNEADATVITGTTILNKSFVEVIGECKNSFNVMLGPTVPPSAVLFKYGVNAIVAIKATDNAQLYSSIAEGAIVPRFKGSEMVTYCREKIELPRGDFRTRI